MKPKAPCSPKTFLSWSVLVGLILFTASGCSVFMAAKQPDAKDLTVLEKGTPRGLVIAELGAPRYTEKEGEGKIDVFKFTEGYSKGAKVGRALFHGAADVLTLGLWEVVGTPTEMYFSGDQMTVKVTYDHKDKIKAAEILDR